MNSPTARRRRLAYLALALGTIALGLAVHLRGARLGPAVRDVAGDALWAGMILWWVGVVAPAARLGRRAGAAVAICWIVEFSQCAHTPGLDAVRATRLGHLVLGSDFDPRDLAAYVLGVAAAALLDRAFRAERTRADVRSTADR